MTRISVIVTCHNYGRFVSEALASLDAQTRTPDEIVIVDDGSTDDSWEVIQGLARDRDDVVLLSRTPATGVVRATNDGVDASSGDLIAILNADDRLSPTYLEMAEAVLRDPSTDFTWTATHQFGAVDVWRPAVPSVALPAIARRCRIHTSGLMRRDLWDALGGLNPSFTQIGCEDWEFWVHAAGSGAIGRPVHGCHLEWRRHIEPSRNRLGPCRIAQVHWTLHRTHPSLVRRRDVLLGLVPTLAAFALARVRVATRRWRRALAAR